VSRVKEVLYLRKVT